MQELDDNALLREYVERDSAPAFAELVTRHVGKVYSTALRHTRNPHQAEEITQAVFVIFAQKARKLGRNVIISGWLYHTARLTAVTFLRSEIRRARREQEALMQTLPNETESDIWPHIAPLLDDALARLSEKDRHAVVLRFFDSKSFGEVGTVLGGSESAAKMRVNRALEKLRKFFAKRGVVLTAAAIAGAVSANSVHAAPAGLVMKISATTGNAMAASTAAIVKGTMKTMLWNSLRTPALAAAAIILAAGTMTLFAQHAKAPVAKIPYKMFEDAWLFEQSINPTNLTFHLLIGTSKKGVTPQDIHLTIQSATQGNITVRLGARGMVLNFPCDDDLRRENPLVVSDQPQGTLGFGYWVYVPRPEELVFRYDHLANAVDEANKAAAHARAMASDYARTVPFFSGTINGIGLHFPKASAGKANITMATTEGLKKYYADSHGIIKLRINPKLQAQNPELIFSERPDWIGIDQF